MGNTGDSELEYKSTSSKLLHAVLWLVPPVIALFIAVSHPSRIIDDSYITYRYAENLARGWGLVFNEGQRILGTSTPLLALILGALKVAGIATPTAGLWIGRLSFAAMVLVIERLAARSMSPLAAIVVGLCVALHPDSIFTMNSGMETALSMLTVFGGLLLALQGRYALAGLVGGAACLLRPDGVLVIILTVGLGLLRDRKGALVSLSMSGLLVAPWMIFATWYYGSPVPHSVPAKQFLYHAGLVEALAHNLALLSFGFTMKVILTIVLAGLFLAWRKRSELLFVAAWMALYLTGLTASHIYTRFQWYISPLYPAALLVAGYGMYQLTAFVSDYLRLQDQGAVTRLLKKAMFPAVLASMLLGEMPIWDLARQLDFDRTTEYFTIGKLLGERCRPEDKVLVAEVGALAFVLPNQEVIDSSGINSEEVYRMRLADRARLVRAGLAEPEDGSTEWIVSLIAQSKPRFIVSYFPWLHMEELGQTPAFEAEFHRVFQGEPGLHDYYVWERNELSVSAR